MDFNNKVAVITGGAKGIGLAIAEGFLKAGSKTVVLIDINADLGTKTADELNAKHGDDKAIFVQGDVTKDLDEVYEKIIAEVETVDILVNNAGVVDETDIKRTLNINTVATVEWSMKFLEHMRKDKGGNGGVILNVSSIYGFFVDPYLVFYKTSKYAVMGFSRTLGHADNFNVTGVRVLTLCPGYTRTDIISDVIPHKALEFHIGHLEDLAEDQWQEVEDVSRVAVEIVQDAESGTAWAFKGGKKAVQVPDVNETLL